MDTQKTISKGISLKGVGLHTGNHVQIKFKPAPVNTGILFIRTDIENAPVIRAQANNLLSIDKNPRRTSIGYKGVEIHTIEHLMAVLAGLGIDNIIIEIDNNEIPGLDGSGANFIEALENAGIIAQDAARKYFVVKEPVWLEEDDASICIFPASEFRISYTLSYPNDLLKAQHQDFILNPEIFIKEIAPSRTFCLEEEADELKRQGLGKGANYENTLVVGEKEVIKNKLRFSDEFVRHKIFDLIGDLNLLGIPIKGHVVALKSGHPLNLKLLMRLKAQKDRFDLAGVTSSSTVQFNGPILEADQIMQILPHRYPFLLVDRIVSLEEGKRAVGVKNVTINDNFFVGHFPNRPVMPGVLIIEAMAQVGGVLMLYPLENRGKLAYFMSINNVKFRKTVVPGDQLILEVQTGKIKTKTGQVHGKASVDGKVVAEADLMFALVES
ncbi:MAG: bifunctional UDP-3-O-[3-hydroxymyristoyl] N-acetylglucosamine deacetylase/3-hydroxyacyl-ACP dehydratase [Candidatus Omnitrophota bacterium]